MRFVDGFMCPDDGWIEPCLNIRQQSPRMEKPYGAYRASCLSYVENVKKYVFALSWLQPKAIHLDPMGTRRLSCLRPD
jgi:hypothetical protein